jgi:hypothetical protein
MEPISEKDPKARLLGTIRINDVPFHAEALQIKLDEEEVQQEMEAVEQSNHHGRCETNIRLKTEHDGFEVNVARTVSRMILSTKKW